MRGATSTPRCKIIRNVFQSTRPMRGATAYISPIHIGRYISIHAPHAGRDCSGCLCPQSFLHFNPRAPCGARPSAYGVQCRNRIISIHAPHAGRDCARTFRPWFRFRISIHAPHAGRDRPRLILFLQSCNFNPRAPCGARRRSQGGRSSKRKFQSTRPMRGATRRNAEREPSRRISIHAPHAGRDYLYGFSHAQTPISIHAPHAGRDLIGSSHEQKCRNFNPRAPCGARHSRFHHTFLVIFKFQSTRPMRGATP